MAIRCPSDRSRPRREAPRAALGEDRDDGDGERESRERGEPIASAFQDSRASGLRSESYPSEWPEVEQQEDGRERDEHGLRQQPEREASRAKPRRPRDGRRAWRTQARIESEEEEPGEHVLPLGHPGHGLEPERVESEERASEGGGRRRHAQREKSEHDEPGVRGVQEDARQVVPPRVQPEELDVGHVRDPGERVPVVDVHGRQRPGDPLAVSPPRTPAFCSTYGPSS